MTHSNWIATITLLVAAGAAHSQSVTYDFKGVGDVCKGTGGNPQVCQSDVPFTGSVTMELLAPGPAGPDSSTDGISFAWDQQGWVQNSFVIRWDDETFIPVPGPEMQRSDSEFGVWNDHVELPEDPFRDQIWNTIFYSEGIYAGRVCEEQVYMARITTDTSWLDGLDFDPSAGLAPGADAVNSLSFGVNCDQYDLAVSGGFTLTELTPRSTRVHIDIRPHADPNYINPESKGFVPVAVLGSAEFDATQVDPQSVRFGPHKATAVDDVRVADVNRDGRPDAVLRFRIRDAGIRFGQHAAALAGKTFAGASFLGVDRILTPGHP